MCKNGLHYAIDHSNLDSIGRLLSIHEWMKEFMRPVFEYEGTYLNISLQEAIQTENQQLLSNILFHLHELIRNLPRTDCFLLDILAYYIEMSVMEEHYATLLEATKEKLLQKLFFEVENNRAGTLIIDYANNFGHPCVSNVIYWSFYDCMTVDHYDELMNNCSA